MSLSNRITRLAAACLLLAPLSATAKEDLCNKILPAEMAVGTYTMTAHNGTMSMMGRTMAWQGGGSKGTTEIHLEGKTLVMTGDSNMRAQFERQVTSIEDWWGEEYLSKLQIKDVDIQLCPTAQSLPRLLANGTGSYFEGGRGDFKMSIFITEVTDKGIRGSGLMHIWNTDNGRMDIRFPFDIDPK